MKAAVCREFGKPLVVEDLRLESPQAGEVRVRIAAVAICHSDITFAEGSWGGPLPALYGHECAGIVEEVGAGVATASVGDHVVVTLIRSCGRCHSCVTGRLTECEGTVPLDARQPITDAKGDAVWQAMKTGGFAEEVLVHESQVVRIPKDVPLASASLLACGVITGFGAVTNAARVPVGSHVVVIGTGGVGLNSIQGAHLSGARSVIAVDGADSKVEAARRFGATHGVNSRTESLPDRVRDITGGRGADYVFVTVGVKAAFDQSYALLAKGGSVVIVGLPPTGVTSEYDPTTIGVMGQRIVGTKMGDSRIQRDIPALVDLYGQRRLKLDELVTKTYPLEGINDAIASVLRGDALRNVIVFEGVR